MAEQKTGAGKTAAITGVSGYIASNLAKQLLNRGYKVRGTVRNLQNKERVNHLKVDLPGVELFEADLLKEGSFADCFDGADIVFHTASPFQLKVEDPQKELVEPALKGTENAVGEAIKKKVPVIVVTSSIAAIRNFHKPKDHVFDENDWNEFNTIENGPYPYSKTVAEKRAWEMVKGTDSKLVTINPSFVLGPALSTRTDSTSVKFVLRMLNGEYKKTGCPPMQFATTDVRDVALAHILAAENPKSHGRYVVSHAQSQSLLQLSQYLRKHFPNYPLPETEDASIKPSQPYAMNAEKVQKELGLVFRSIETSLVDMAKALIAAGMIQL